MFIWLFRMLCGEIAVAFTGDSPERILNITAANRIRLRGVRLSKNGISALITPKNFKKLRCFLRGSGLRAHITRKMGLPFILKRYRARSGFLVGAVLFFSILKFLSCFIWTVNVNGNKTVSEKEILEASRKVGVYEGAFADNINTTGGAQRLLIDCPELAWASLNIENCVITVNVTEIKKTDRDKSATPTNLISNADGVITGIDVTAGNVLVKIGDVVSKGDLLVSGVVDSMDSTVFVRSKGTVTARTERTLSANCNFTVKKQQSLKKVKKRAVLEVLGVKVPLYIGKVKTPYTSQIKIKQACFFKSKLPIKLTVKTFNLTKEVKIKYNNEQLLGILRNDINKQTKKLGLNNVKIISENIIETEEGLKLEQIISADEKISAEDVILFDTIN